MERELKDRRNASTSTKDGNNGGYPGNRIKGGGHCGETDSKK
jgi:hypothetical protein